MDHLRRALFQQSAVVRRNVPFVTGGSAVSIRPSSTSKDATGTGTSAPPPERGHPQQHPPIEDTLPRAAAGRPADGTVSAVAADPHVPSGARAGASAGAAVAAPHLTGLTAAGSNYDAGARPLAERLGQIWSDRSGTSEILALKESVNNASLAFDAASAAVTRARTQLDGALRQWERTSGRHMQLLQRRESWTAEDAQQFADLASQEIASRNALAKAREGLAVAEETLTQRQLEYMNSMRRRYHEEQVWQDQWRVAGTYWTWILIVLNTCVFMGSQYFQRSRENSRMKAIEQLIQEKIPHALTMAALEPEAIGLTTSDLRIQMVEPGHDASEGTMVTATTTEGLLQATNDKVERKDVVPPKEGDEKVRTNEQSIDSSIGTVLSSLKEQAKIKWLLLQARTHQIVNAIPAASSSLVEEMPKSASEIHIPSAIVGAVVAGITMLFFSILVPSRRR